MPTVNANIRQKFLESYIEKPFESSFLTSWFKTTPRDIVMAEKVNIDVMRSKNIIAPVITAQDERVPKIERSRYEEREVIPPIVGLGYDITAKDIGGKIFGMDPFESANYDYTRNLLTFNADKMRNVESAINNHIELQASQILQTGKLDLNDKNGNSAYKIDFGVKASHLPSVTTAWSDTTNADPIQDIENLCKVILKDGKVKVKSLIFGETAWKNFTENTKIKDKLNLRRANTIIIDPKYFRNDATLQGELYLGSEKVICYTYDSFYQKNDRTTVDYLDTNKIIFLPDSTENNYDFRKVYALVPNLTGVDARLASIIQALPDFMNLGDRAYTFRMWVNDKGDSIEAELKTRPILIPVSTDSFGCLKTTTD